MNEKSLKRVPLILVFILWFGFLLACNLSSETIQKTTSEDEINKDVPTITVTFLSNTSLDQDVINTISSELANNQTEIDLDPSDFKYLENPVGEGIFIYEPKTNFFGVERFFIWLYLNNNIYVVNGATRDITPNFPIARDVPYEVWNSTKLSPYSALDLIGYIFDGKELIPWDEKPAPTVTPLPEILFGYTIEERKQIYYDLVAAEDKADLENKGFSYYHQEVADKYGITLEQLDQIGDEGLSNHWPMPPLP